MEKATDVYQKTVEKTSSLFARVKENTAYKSFEERLGGVVSAAKSKMPVGVGGGGGDFEEAFKEGEKAAAAGAEEAGAGVGAEQGAVAPPQTQETAA